MDSKPKDRTRVDLGEDLLEKTKHLEPEKYSSEKKGSGLETPDLLLKKAEILFNERLFGEAKKIFFKIVRTDPNNARARELLGKIYDEEMKELLGSDPNRRKLGEVDQTTGSEDTLQGLDRDLKLGLEKAELRVVPDLFPTEVAFTRFKEQTLKTAIQLNLKERLDLGTAFLEMGLNEIAKEIFETVVRYTEYRLTGTYLLCLALINLGKGVEATIRIEPIVRDLGTPEEQKINFLYLMGLAFESLKDQRRAKDFFRRVHLLNPRYRNVAEKMKN